MDVILICPDFQKDNLVPLRDFQANFFESGINLLSKNDPPIFGWTHQMIDQHGDIVALMDILTHKGYGNTPEQSEASFGESDPQRFNANDLDGVMAFFADDAVYDEFNGTQNTGTAKGDINYQSLVVDKSFGSRSELKIFTAYH